MKEAKDGARSKTEMATDGALSELGIYKERMETEEDEGKTKSV